MNPEKKLKYSQNAIAKAKSKYNWDLIAKEYEKDYIEFIKEKKYLK